MTISYLCIVFIVYLNDCLFAYGKTCTDQSQLNDFESTILKYHNHIRYKHEDTDPLCWSMKLAGSAQLWAQKIIDDGGAIKSSNNGYIPETDADSVLIVRYGENIYKQNMVVDLAELSPIKGATDSVIDWNNEESQYRYSIPRHSDSTKHFTQLVWRDTTELGCGMAVRDSHYFVVVCNYNPGGNEGASSEYRDNVQHKKSCEFPDWIQHGKILQRAPFYLNQKVTVKCKAGFALKGTGQGVCKTDGWDFGDKETSCTGCVIPSTFNGTSTPAVNSVISDQDWVTYTCNLGFSLDSAIRVIQCEGNKLTQEIPRCRAEGHCLRPIIKAGYAYAPDVDDKMELMELYKTNIPEGSNIDIDCLSGYDLVGNKTAVCKDGDFGPIGTCNQCYIKDTKSIYNQYINVFTGVKHKKPPICFAEPGASEVASSYQISLHLLLSFIIIVLLNIT